MDMNKKTLPLLGITTLAILIFLSLPSFQEVRSAGSLNVSLEVHATGLSNAVDIANADSNKLYVVERPGKIRIISPLGNVRPTPYLDIQARVLSTGGEQGLLGLAFHPNYDSNGYFYVNYTRDAAGTANDGDTVISRFQVSAGDPNIADPNSETILLVIDQPDSQTNHNGGGLEFGPDGYLYIALGDGGSFGDPWENSQSLDTLLGKMLRIDVNGGGGRDTCSLQSGVYGVPANNPFVDGSGGDCDEIWAWGLRNPWRFSFDSLTGDMWIGDVGQNAWEEIDFQPAASNGGENWGWDCYEGNAVYNDPSPGVNCGGAGNYEFPEFAYSHGSGRCSVTGGHVYRGATYPELYGHYLFADYCNGWLWSLFPDGQGSFTDTFLGDMGGLFTTFGENRDGDLFITNGFTIYQIVEDTLATPTATFTPAPPTNTPTITPTPTITLTPTPVTPTPTPFPQGAPFAFNLAVAATGLSEPSALAGVPGEPEVYAAERGGRLVRFTPGNPGLTTVLDISAAVDDSGFQEGLLGLAFDPDFTTNGHFYINYTDLFSNTVVSRFTMTATLPVGAGSEQVILTLPQPVNDNNGGGLAFGPDGYLYIALGDGGGFGDPSQLAQDPFDLHGKILRLDVAGGGGPPDCGAGSYTVPAGNPFTGGGGCGEIWALGFRNIWGLSFDAMTGDLWIADVGNQSIEEINFQPASSSGGENYGWSCYEGSLQGPNYDPGSCTAGYVFPLHEYDHSQGHSVTGGAVYRGGSFPFMDGYYFFADYVFGKIWTLEPGSGVVVEHFAIAGSWSALAPGGDGELYIADISSGSIYRLEGVDLSDTYVPLLKRQAKP